MSEQDEKGLQAWYCRDREEGEAMADEWPPRADDTENYTRWYDADKVDPLLEAKDARIKELEAKLADAHAHQQTLEAKIVRQRTELRKKHEELVQRWTEVLGHMKASAQIRAEQAEDSRVAQERIRELEARADGLQELLNEEAPVMFADYERDPDRIFPRDGSPLEVEIQPDPADPSELKARVNGLESVLANMVAFLNPQRAKLKGLRHSHMLMSALDAAEGLLGPAPADPPVGRRELMYVLDALSEALLCWSGPEPSDEEARKVYREVRERIARGQDARGDS